MARVTFPCFSFEATGTLDTNFYFQRRKSGFIFGFIRPNKIPQSVAQHYYRRTFGRVIELWRIETPASIQTYNRISRRLNMSSLNLYYKNIFARIVHPTLGNATLGISKLGNPAS